MMPARISALAAVFSLGLAPASAQPVPFEAAMEDALSGAGLAAPLIRCTALFRAFRLHGGAGTPLRESAAAREADLAATSIAIWQSDTGTGGTEAAVEAIVPMVGAATDLFLARMGANQQAVGGVLDPELETELVYCVTLQDEIAAQGDG
jgi:hypothetical protein